MVYGCGGCCRSVVQVGAFQCGSRRCSCSRTTCLCSLSFSRSVLLVRSTVLVRELQLRFIPRRLPVTIVFRFVRGRTDSFHLCWLFDFRRIGFLHFGILRFWLFLRLFLFNVATKTPGTPRGRNPWFPWFIIVDIFISVLITIITIIVIAITRVKVGILRWHWRT